MRPGPAPREAERLAAVRAYGILDTPPEPAFDDIARVAASICGTQMAGVTIIDRDRQWHKAMFGAARGETARDDSFCGHTVLTPMEVLVVPDARLDGRFSDNPYVVGDPHVRFYAGAPLTTADGLALGSLCVFDYEPRRLSEDQLAALRALARQVMAQLDLRRQAAVLEAFGRALEDVARGRSALDVAATLPPGMPADAAARVVAVAEARDAAEAARREAAARAERAERDRAMDAFRRDVLNRVAHELNTPLTPARVHAHVMRLAADRTGDAAMTRSAETVERSIERIASVVDNVLEVVRLDSGEIRVDPAPCDLAATVHAALKAAEPAAARAGVRLDARVPAAVPALADAAVVERILARLLSNAIRFSPEGAVVRVEAGVEAGRAVVRVRDAGSGISPGRLAAVSGAMSAAHDHMRDPRAGAGLGLHIARSLAERQGGSVVLASEGEGRGATATLDLPAG